jgi:lipopolysaccharide heptosyltransferase II
MMRKRPPAQQKTKEPRKPASVRDIVVRDTGISRDLAADAGKIVPNANSDMLAGRDVPLKAAADPVIVAVSVDEPQVIPGPMTDSDGVIAPVRADETQIPRVGPVILIEIDPAVSGGYVGNRYDVMIRGRAMSTAPIEEVRLQVGEWVTSVGSYGQPERAVPGVMPDGTPARQRAFQFNLPRPGDGRAERCAFQIVARTEDDFEYAADFVVELDSTAAAPVSVISGPTRSAGSFGGARAFTIMYIERATIDGDGILAVQGWAVSLGPILALQIFAGDERIAKAKMGGDREDVGAAYPGYPNARLSGFGLTIQLDEASRKAETVRAQVICPNGFGHEESIPVERLQRRSATPPLLAAPDPGPRSFSLFSQNPVYQVTADFRMEHDPLAGLILPPRATSPVILSSPPPRSAPVNADPAPDVPPPALPAEIVMYCDAAELTGDGVLSLDGWAVCVAGIAQVRVLLDDEDVGLATFGHQREDVGRIHPDIPMAHLAGFRFERSVGARFEGRYEVRVVVCGAQGGEIQKQIAVVATEVAPPPVIIAIAPPTEAESTPEQAAEFRFELDSPALSNGAMIEMVTGRLTIEGWLLTRSGIASLEVLLDDQRLGDAHYGLARQDVGAAFPEWPNALRSGFAFHCPPRSLRDGEHTLRLAIRANSGLEMHRSFQVTVKKSDDQDDAVSIRRRVPRVEADMMATFLAGMDYRPVFQFILRQGPAIDIASVTRTLDALRMQAYTDWTVVVLVENDDVATAMNVIIDESMPHLVDRFSILCPAQAAAWATPLSKATDGRTVLHALLLPGDEPGADALLELAVAGGRNPGEDLLYGDEVRISPVSKEREPFFKPDFSPDLLLSTNYIGRLWVATAALLAKTGATPASLAEFGEYDLVLRCVELATGVHHIPKLLCQRAAMDLDDPIQEQTALESMLVRRAIPGQVLATQIAGTWRVKRAVPSRGKVSIIIPTCAANGYIETCINTLRAKTSYQDYEIICVDNIPNSEMGWKAWVREHSDKVVDMPDGFNWSAFNNRAAEVADGEYLLFLNDDIEITQAGWLDALVEHAQRPDVGIVGPQLLYRDGKVQHAGMFLSLNGTGRHAFRFAANDDPCYFGLALTQRNVMAVTGACMLVRRETFERLGRFDEAHEIINNDLDFCLRAHRAGLLTVYTPYASLIHYELASRAGLKDVFNLTHFNTEWKTTFAAGDPYFNPRLSRSAEDYRPDDEPVQWVVSGSPMFHVEEIQRILVVKLDHIGDFVTALPPIRRLKKIFPNARITVLAGPASRGFVSLEPCIDEFIPFSFFHARSQLGERELTSDDYAKLADQLRPYRFDLAVDLRKHLSTRDVLKYTGARFLAGFDYLGQFPFLDIALDWDGDRTLQRKRSHIVDDLMALANAVGHATENDRLLMQPGPSAMPLTELPEDVQALFAKPVVAIHPGAGNITKQWPEEHFSALIDLLIERNNVNIMLVGGPDDVEVADRLMKTILHTGAIASMAGKTPLADLPRLLKNCTLYIGNDSGPKHIAAAVGIPTVGIHSGVVDPVEWGPIGPTAVALRRNMTCSPCYLANASDCPRSLACLRSFEPSMVYETANLMLKPPRPDATPCMLVQERAAHEPAAHELAAQEPAARDPAEHEPAAHEPAAHEPAAHEPAAHEPAAHEPAAQEPAPAKSVRKPKLKRGQRVAEPA